MKILFIDLIYFLIYWVSPLIITLASECGIARLFKFNRIWMICLMNFVTNIYLTYAITYMELHITNYITAVVIGEIVVYTVEFLALYLSYRKTRSKKNILQYTIIANTTSLVATLMFNKVVLYFLA